MKMEDSDTDWIKPATKEPMKKTVSETEINRTLRRRSTKSKSTPTKVKGGIPEDDNESAVKVKEINNVFFCSLCQFSTSKKAVVTMHYKRHHMNFWGGSEERTWKCSECACAYTTEKHLQRHVKTSHKRQIKCDKCNFTTTNQNDLDNHTCSKKKLFQCSMCPFTADLRIKVVSHEKSHTKKAKKTISLEVKQEKSETKLERKKNEKSKTLDDDLIKPEMVKKESSDRVEVNQEETDSDDEKLDSGILVCDLCFNYRASSPKLLYYHKRTVHKVLSKPKSELNYYKCMACSFDTVFFDELKTHLIETHKFEKVNKEEIDKRALKCSYCLRPYWCGYSLAHHKYKFHNDSTDLEKWNFKCTACDKYESNQIKRIKAHVRRSSCWRYPKNNPKNIVKFRKYFKGTYLGICKWEIGRPFTSDLDDASDIDKTLSAIKQESSPAVDELNLSSSEEDAELGISKNKTSTTEVDVDWLPLEEKTPKKRKSTNKTSMTEDYVDWLPLEEKGPAKKRKSPNKSSATKDNLQKFSFQKEDDTSSVEIETTSRKQKKSNKSIGSLTRPEDKTMSIKEERLEESSAEMDDLEWLLSEEEDKADSLQNDKTPSKKRKLDETSVSVDDLDWLSSEEDELFEQDIPSVFTKDDEVITIEVVPDHKEETKEISEDNPTEYLSTSPRASFNTVTGEFILENSLESDKTEKISDHKHNKRKDSSVRFSCSKPNCGYYCFNFATLQRHIKLHQERNDQVDKNGVYECQKCGSSNLHGQMLQIHTNFHAKSDTDSVTEISYLKYFNGKLVGEIKLKPTVGENDNTRESIPTPVGIQSFKCELCGVDICNKSSLKYHTRSHAKARKKNAQLEVTYSEYLNGKYVGKITATSDFVQVSEFDPEVDQEFSDGGDEESFIDGRPGYKCQKCQLTLYNKKSLTQHTIVHARIARNLNIEIVYLELVNNKCVKTIKMIPDLNYCTASFEFKCPECNLFLIRPYVEGHINEHSELEGDPKYKLNFSIYFSRKLIGTMEIKARSDFDIILHTYPPTYRCGECSAPLTSKTSMVGHANSHAKKKKGLEEIIYSEYKNKVFLSKLRIKTNVSGISKSIAVVVDPDLPVFSCTECNYKSNDEDALEKHKGIHWNAGTDKNVGWNAGTDKNVGRASFNCTECNFKTNNEKLFTKHKSLHWSPQKETALQVKRKT